MRKLLLIQHTGLSLSLGTNGYEPHYRWLGGYNLAPALEILSSDASPLRSKTKIFWVLMQKTNLAQDSFFFYLSVDLSFSIKKSEWQCLPMAKDVRGPGLTSLKSKQTFPPNHRAANIHTPLLKLMHLTASLIHGGEIWREAEGQVCYHKFREQRESSIACLRWYCRK